MRRNDGKTGVLLVWEMVPDTTAFYECYLSPSIVEQLAAAHLIFGGAAGNTPKQDAAVAWLNGWLGRVEAGLVPESEVKKLELSAPASEEKGWPWSLRDLDMLVYSGWLL